MINRIRSALLGVILPVITACGGGGVAALVADGGIGGTGILSLGPIVAFGSVVVNGTTFEINGTTITVDGVEATQDDLQVGFVVRIESGSDNTTANRIDFAVTVRGQIDALTVNNFNELQATLTVLGQTVTTNNLTNFVNTGLQDPAGPANSAALIVGNFVDISGVRDAQGNIVASFIEQRTDDPELRVMGPVSNVTATTFDIAGLTVDFSSANLNDLPGGAPVENAEVKVRGTVFINNPSPLLEATEVEPALTLNPATDDEVELEGIVTRLTSVSDFEVNFEVNGQRVNVVIAQTTFENGMAEDIQLNTQLEVEGTIDANGVLQADKVDIRPDNIIRIDAEAERVDIPSNTVTLLGLDIVVDEFTRLEDKSDDADGSPFGVDDISIGDRIEMRGFQDGSNIVASRLEREDSDADVSLQGPITVFNPGSETVTILTVQVSTDGGTEFEGPQGAPLSAGQFFDLLELGSIVKAKWDPFSSTAAPADELSLEN